MKKALGKLVKFFENDAEIKAKQSTPLKTEDKSRLNMITNKVDPSDFDVDYNAISVNECDSLDLFLDCISDDKIASKTVTIVDSKPDENGDENENEKMV